MDIHTPDFAATPDLAQDPQSPTSRICHNRLLQSLAATMPVDRAADPKAWAEQWDHTRETYDSLAPSDPAEAALAAFAVPALQGAMDSLARASRPGISDDRAARLRGGALAAGRVYAAVFRTLRKQQAAASDAARAATPAEPAPAVDPAADGFINPLTGEPIPRFEEFQPRDRFGQPIPTWRAQDMTMAQRRATYAFPRDPELEAIATAEEDAMIAEQAANPDPAPPVTAAPTVTPANAGTQGDRTEPHRTLSKASDIAVAGSSSSA